LTAVTILAELGDARRFSSSRDAVRHSGLDITVKQSDQRRRPGHLSRQGPPALRWTLFETVQTARRAGSPDHEYYVKTAERIGGNRACLALTQAPQAHVPHAPRGRRGGAHPSLTIGAREALANTDAPRPAPRILLPTPTRQSTKPRRSQRPIVSRAASSAAPVSRAG
jgi:hypothetical protein